jgi:ATP-dependent exoDNAse (exonuclease V), alpha subunit - helicase superfamily I member
MGLTPDQMARLMRGVKLQQRAKVAGVKGPETREERRLFQHIDSQNIARAKTEAAKAPPRPVTPGLINFDGAPRSLEESGLTADGFTFDDSQIAALDKLIHGKHVCLIGAAGTGKTTMVKHAMAKLIYGGDDVRVNPMGIRRLSGDQGPSIAICAFTGIATQVVRSMLPSWLHPACKTIHTLLEYKPVDQNMDDESDRTSQRKRGMFMPTRNANYKLDHDLIVIDEASMLGLDLWHNLVDALRPHTRVILIGDLNQLKPVADATMFAYALSAGIDQKDGWDIAELTTIHRQKEPAANKIIDAAHAILNGKQPKFDDPEKDPDWRFVGLELPPQGQRAHAGIVSAIEFFRNQPTPGGTDPERKLFDPYKDLLLTAGNGFDENDSASFVQQSPLNATLSRLIEPPSDDNPMYIIDAGRETRRFAVGHRVMATKNESPDTKDRVTNGLTGRIVRIEPNKNWNGKKGQFGTEKEVNEWRAAQAKALLNGNANGLGVDLESFKLGVMDTSKMEAMNEVERQSSHIITVRYGNGAERVYRTAADVESIRLAYAITVHKAQGSQADTVVIVCHHAVKRQLSREWLYTAVTRARKRVILLYTRMGLSTAISRQQIFGATLKEKVNRYRQVMEGGNVHVRLRAYDNVLGGIDPEAAADD